MQTIDQIKGLSPIVLTEGELKEVKGGDDFIVSDDIAGF